MIVDIHPYDLAELLEATDTRSIIYTREVGGDSPFTAKESICSIDGVEYRQNPATPRRPGAHHIV